MGLLKITGEIRLDQFWPRGKSTSDASKMRITVGADSFLLDENKTGNFKPISIFDEGTVEYNRKKIGLVKRGNQIICRLRGVDAPELNYTFFGPTPHKHPVTKKVLSGSQYQQLIAVVNNANYRQPMAETSVVKLAQIIATAGKGNTVPCVFVADVQTSQDVCDCYGRFVGDIYIYPKGKEINLNNWLLHNGWAFPALYNCFDSTCIQKVLSAAQNAKEKRLGVYPHYRKFFGRFEEIGNYRSPTRNQTHTPDVPNNNAYLVMPKLFRKWCRYNMYLQAGIQPGSFADFLNASTPGYFNTHDYINSNTEILQPAALSAIATRNRIETEPTDIVFIKKTTVLKNKYGELVNGW